MGVYTTTLVLGYTAKVFFVRSGYVRSGNHYLDYAGYNGSYWSSVASLSSNAYYLYFDSNGIYPSGGSNRYYGHSVRCVAPSA